MILRKQTNLKVVELSPTTKTTFFESMVGSIFLAYVQANPEQYIKWYEEFSRVD